MNTSPSSSPLLTHWIRRQEWMRRKAYLLRHLPPWPRRSNVVHGKTRGRGTVEPPQRGPSLALTDLNRRRAHTIVIRSVITTGGGKSSAPPRLPQNQMRQKPRREVLLNTSVGLFMRASNTLSSIYKYRLRGQPVSLNFKTAGTLIAILAIILAFYNSLRAALPRVAQVAEPTTASAAKRAMSTTTATATTANGTSANLKITKRPWNNRGHADHGWLYTFHTFSFASYYDPAYESFGPLRVINEDRVEKGTGFGTHGHAEFGIWSYIVSGELEHKDSMGNLEKLRRGEVQFTNAGTGIRHSEYNRNREGDVHFLQIWAKPNVRGLKPSYCTRKYTDEMKQDKLVRIMEAKERHSGKEGATEPIEIYADVSMDASILSPGKSVEHELVKEGERNVYLHLVMSERKQPKTGGAKIKIGDVELGEGDGAFVKAKGPGKVQVESIGDKPAEFLLFDMGEQ
ncbi:hypothetical protein BST61_g1284 [Cercospora zeina]